jgi:predicted  nucleic acid-binding Zn-ribbon protein
MLWEQLAAEQESSTALVDQLDELKRKIEKTERELDEYKKRQQEEYNNLCELGTRFSSSGNSQFSTPAA